MIFPFDTYVPDNELLDPVARGDDERQEDEYDRSDELYEEYRDNQDSFDKRGEDNPN